MKIATDAQVLRALKVVFRKQKVINSQRKLKKLVAHHLKAKVSERRLRILAINSGFIKIEIHSREGNPEKVLTKCPVCGTSLKRVKNLTIWGGRVTIEFSCPLCGYWTGKRKRIPTRYVFYKKQ